MSAERGDSVTRNGITTATRADRQTDRQIDDMSCVCEHLSTELCLKSRRASYQASVDVRDLARPSKKVHTSESWSE